MKIFIILIWQLSNPNLPKGFHICVPKGTRTDKFSEIGKRDLPLALILNRRLSTKQSFQNRRQRNEPRNSSSEKKGVVSEKIRRFLIQLPGT